ncbi:MAG TPA: type I 3-dehydroquinate dehydratase [Thermoanaerobaculia bacterium]|nr:type I 3-dehydroquinate dehydratase [Thermoanaerobaculia bacterium]
MNEASLTATLSAPPNGELGVLRAVRGLEVRADLAGDLDADWLRDRFAGELTYSLRRRATGGAFEGTQDERRRRLLAAARRFDLVEVGEGDLEPGHLEGISPAQRLASWSGAVADAAGLREAWERLSRVPARLYRLEAQVERPQDALALLRWLRGLGRRDVTAFATGPAGTWTRLLAPRLGAPVAFGCLAGGADGTGELTVSQLAADYGFPALRPLERTFGIAGGSVGRSLSPRLHNAAYQELGLPALYLPFQVDGFAAFWREAVTGLEELGWPLRGLTVTSPYKEEALTLAGEVSSLARQAGSANTLLRRRGTWRADTADAQGVISALARRRIPLAGREVAVVGCGGAGRAAAAGLLRAGARVTLVNRGRDRGEYASRLLGLPFVPLSRFQAGDFSLVVHATPLVAESPFPLADLSPGAVVVELVYGAAPTPLMVAMAARGGVAIDGREVLRVEVRRQFRLMTGRRMPAEPGRELIGSAAER